MREPFLSNHARAASVLTSARGGAGRADGRRKQVEDVIRSDDGGYRLSKKGARLASGLAVVHRHAVVRRQKDNKGRVGVWQIDGDALVSGNGTVVPEPAVARENADPVTDAPVERNVEPLCLGLWSK